MSEHNMGQVRSEAVRQDAYANAIEGTKDAAETAKKATQIESDGKLRELLDEGSPVAIVSKGLKQTFRREVKSEKTKHAQESVLVRKEDADGLAGEFSQREGNREYHLDPVMLSILAAEELGEGINPDSTPDEVIALIQKRMEAYGGKPDVSLVDKAFEFLLEVMEKQLKVANEGDKPRMTAIFGKIQNAKVKHFESHSAEIKVAQRIISSVGQVVDSTGETISEGLERHRDYRTLADEDTKMLKYLRQVYEDKGSVLFKKELKALKEFLRENFQRTNLDRGEMHDLAQIVRSMQAYLGVMRTSGEKVKILADFMERAGALEMVQAA